MLALFPKSNEKITIAQGQIGDCYLLASLDCVLSIGEEGLGLIKSLFTENLDGSVTLRIKITDQSANLRPEKLLGKYTYSYDKLSNYDIFTISKARLLEIDQTEGGVQTNSLAIKILEHISSYYYIASGDDDEIQNSALAHNFNTVDRFSGASNSFVAKFIGIEDHETNDIDEVIKLKTINPDAPIYISMDWDAVDAQGQTHDRHGLRVKKIVAKGDGKYDFILVNPWNNQTEETFTLDDIKKRDYRFCKFSIDKCNYAVTSALLKCPEEHGKLILSNPQLLSLFSKMHIFFIELSPKNIRSCLSLYQQIPSFFLRLNSFPLDEQTQIMHCMISSSGEKSTFIKSFLNKLPRFNLNNSEKIINASIAEITNHPVNFKDLSQEEIESHHAHLIKWLESKDQLSETVLIQRMLGIADSHHKIVEAINQKKKIIEQAAAQQQQIVTLSALNVVNSYEMQINDFQISFVEAITIEDVYKLRTHYIDELNNLIKNKSDLDKANKVLGIDSHHEKLTVALYFKKNELDMISTFTKKKIITNTVAKNVIQQIKFSSHLQTLEEMATTLETKAGSNNGVKEALSAARKLHEHLSQAKDTFFNSSKHIDKALTEFKSICLNAIDNALAILGKQPGCKQTLENIATAVQSISNVEVINEMMPRWGLFTSPHSAKAPSKIANTNDHIASSPTSPVLIRTTCCNS
jgi:hypothetical protein